MKRKVVILLSVVLAMAICLTACAQNGVKDENSEESIVQEGNDTVEDSESAVIETTETTPVESEATQEAVVENKEYKTVEADLSFMGEIINDLFIISNDESALKTKEDVFNYLNDKAYAFYPYSGADADNTVASGEARESGMFIIKPESVLQYANNDKYSDVMFSFADWTGVGDRLSCVQYQLKDCTDETMSQIREHFNKVVADGVFDNYEYEVIHNNDTDTWTTMKIQIKGEPINPAQYCDYFCEISIYLDSTLIDISIY